VTELQAELGGPGSDAPTYVEPLLEQREAQALHQQDGAREEQPTRTMQQREAPQETTPEPAASAQPPASESGPPRRRSTVREPAPVSFSGEPAPGPVSAYVPPAEPSQPTETSETSESEDTSRPRRAGWWSRRVLGKS